MFTPRLLTAINGATFCIGQIFYEYTVLYNDNKSFSISYHPIENYLLMLNIH
jgi:hypothetical protein